MINKRFFLMNASITTLVQLKALVCQKSLCYSLQSTLPARTFFHRESAKALGARLGVT